MTIRVRIHPGPWTASFERGHIVRIGRGRANDIRVGHQLVGGRWTVSKEQAVIRWDGTRWATLNVSQRPGLLSVYEPGYEEVPLEPGRLWAPVRHRWSYSIGRPDYRFHVVCVTGDHLGPAAVAAPPPAPDADPDDEEPTAGFDMTVALSFTPLERSVIAAYYDDFARLPRPCLLYTSPSPRDRQKSRMPSSA